MLTIFSCIDVPLKRSCSVQAFRARIKASLYTNWLSMIEAAFPWRKQIEELLSVLAQPGSSLFDIQITHLLIDEQMKSKDTDKDKSCFAQEIEPVVCQKPK